MAVFLPKTLCERKNTPVKVKNPAITDKKRPAKSGSEKTLKIGISIHIKSGVLPSVREINRRVGSALMTCAHLIYIASSAKMG